MFTLKTELEINEMTKKDILTYIRDAQEAGFTAAAFNKKMNKDELISVAVGITEPASEQEKAANDAEKSEETTSEAGPNDTLTTDEGAEDKAEGEAETKPPERRESGYYTVDAMPEGGCNPDAFGEPNDIDPDCQECTVLTLCREEEKVRRAAESATTASKRKNGAVKGAGSTPFGHNRGAISGKIDLMLMAPEGATIEDIATACECTEQRVRAHINKDLKVGMRNNGIPAVVIDMGEGRFRVEVPKVEETPAEEKEEATA